MANKQCDGEHHYFVADVAQITQEGKVCIIALCTACGDTQMTVHQVAGQTTKKG